MAESYESYLAMLKDSTRVRLWEEAIRQAVKPGDVVVEIGTGVGTFGFFAVRAGAAKVYAIEADRVIDVAREIAASGGLLDRIEFLEGHSTAVALAETADVVLYEDFSPFFFDTEMAGILGDARRRFLKPGGRLLPRRASVRIALIENEQTYQEMLDPLVGEAPELYGLDLGALRELILNGLAYQELTPGQMLAEPCTIHRIDLQQQTPEPVGARHTFNVSRPGTAHGLAVWFDLDLGDGLELSNSPGTPIKSWQQGILPLERPIPFRAGQLAEVEVRTVVSKFYGCHWNWMVRSAPSNGSRPIVIRQTSFRGQPLPQALARYLRLAGREESVPEGGFSGGRGSCRVVRSAGRNSACADETEGYRPDSVSACSTS
jgi:protein arginine N-methyltransferase 1